MIKFLLHRPIAVVMTALGILILGIFASTNIPISLMPDIDIQEVTIQVNAKNYAANELENSVTKPLRNSLLQLNHLEDLVSETTNGLVTIKLYFSYGTPIDYTFIEVNEKTDRILSLLPKDIERPKVIKASASDIPVFYLYTWLKNSKANTETYAPSEEFVAFSEFTNQVIQKRIEQIPEVALVDLSGLTSPEILIIPDQAKCLALGISLQDIEDFLKEQQLEIGSIVVRESQYQYNLKLQNTLNNLKDVQETFFNKNGKLFQLQDIATIQQQPKKRKGLVLSNGKEAISLAVIKQSDARIEDLKVSLEETIAAMTQEYPTIGFTIMQDQTKLLDVAIGSLRQSLVWGIGLAFLVMFFFLSDLKSPILIGITVPISIMVCLLLFQLIGISINSISLSGLVLGIGLMIDNSIIVIDNIAQYRQRGVSLTDACIQGTTEVFRPLVSSMLTTCAVFIPLIFLSGITGTLFFDQAMAITIGLFVSLLISILLLPVLYKMVHPKTSKKNTHTTWIKKLHIIPFETIYKHLFRSVMKRQAVVFVLFFGCCFAAVLLFYSIPKRVMPKLSSSEILLKIDWNESINVEENKRRVAKITKSFEQILKNYSAFIGQQQFLLNDKSNVKSSESTLYFQTDSYETLSILQQEIENLLQRYYPKVVYSFEEVDNIFSLIFSKSNDALVARIGYQEQKNPPVTGLENLRNNIQKELPEASILPIITEENQVLIADKEKMTLYGVSSQVFLSTLKSAFGEKQISSVLDQQNYIPILLGQEPQTLLKTLQETQVRVNDTTFFAVSDFIKIETQKDLKVITSGKEGRYYPIVIHLVDEKKSMNVIQSIVRNFPEFEVSFSGNLLENQKLTRELLFSLLTTLVLLYFILASQFESLTLPLIILIEIPASIAGALLALYLLGHSLNLMSMIGIIVMSGIVINDSILKIDTTLQLQRQGMGLLKALTVAGQRRLRPILMTSFTTILALIPILFMSGMGAELQAPLVISLIGGMILGTLVSLYFIPVCYYNFFKLKKYATS